MEFREYYRGVCAKIRFDSRTHTYIGELDVLPSRAFLEADSYESLLNSYKQVVDDYLAGKTPNLDEEHWAQASKLKSPDLSTEAKELEQAMAKIAAELENNKN